MPENDLDLSTIDSTEKADALLDTIEAPSASLQDTAPTTTQAQQDEWDLTVGGKQIKAKRDQVMQWAQQGYSAPGKIAQYTRELESLKKQLSESEPKYKELESKYGPVDEYVRQNPQFWDHVVQSYQQRSQLLQDQSNPIAQEIGQLRAQLQEFGQFKSQLEQQQQQQRIQQEDYEYTKTLAEIKKSYADVDFDSAGEDGLSLEQKVLQYGIENGIRNFKTAFKDFYHDELIKRAEAKAKESVTKEKMKSTKMGILGITPTSSKQTTSDHRGKSYDDIANEIKQSLGL